MTPACARHLDGDRRPLAPWVPAVLAVLAGLGLAVLLAGPAVEEHVAQVVDNLAQLGAAVLACLMCAAAAARTGQSHRRAWWLLAGGAGSWAAGQGIWSWIELVEGREVPFPAVSDAGFVAFPLLCAAGLLAWLYEGRTARHQVRDLLDGALIAGALLMLSWTTTLSAVQAEAGRGLALVLSMAYPIGDVVLATLVLLTLARSAPGQRAPLVLLAGGLGGLALSDSAYVYLIAVGDYATGSAISSGWITGFLLIAAAARHSAAAQAVPGTALQREQHGTWLRLALPYLPLLAAEAVLGDQLLGGADVSVWLTALGLVLIVLMLARQFLVLADNHALVSALREREAQLAHQAFHDPLTGLANRALFHDRVEQLVIRDERHGGGGAVLFCDLDDFKNVNDTLGHAAGDALLVELAERLRGEVRAVDTVARLGGDEFAVLLEARSEPAETVASRLVAALAEPVAHEGGEIRVSVSIGVAILPFRTGADEDAGDSGEADRPDDSPSARAQQVLRTADRAMYLAKAAGKNGHSSADAEVAPGRHDGAGAGRHPQVRRTLVP